MKLKDYQYQIKGVNSNRPALECLQAISIGLALPVVIAIVIRLISEI